MKGILYDKNTVRADTKRMAGETHFEKKRGTERRRGTEKRFRIGQHCMTRSSCPHQHKSPTSVKVYFLSTFHFELHHAPSPRLMWKHFTLPSLTLDCVCPGSNADDIKRKVQMIDSYTSSGSCSPTGCHQWCLDGIFSSFFPLFNRWNQYFSSKKGLNPEKHSVTSNR